MLNAEYRPLPKEFVMEYATRIIASGSLPFKTKAHSLYLPSGLNVKRKKM